MGASATHVVDYCNDVEAPSDFLIHQQFSNLPFNIDLSFEDYDMEEDFECLIEADVDLDALRCTSLNHQSYFFILRRGDKSETQFPNLLKAVNAQYENRSQRFPKPSYYHFLFRLYPF